MVTKATSPLTGVSSVDEWQPLVIPQSPSTESYGSSASSLSSSKVSVDSHEIREVALSDGKARSEQRKSPLDTFTKTYEEDGDVTSRSGVGDDYSVSSVAASLHRLTRKVMKSVHAHTGSIGMLGSLSIAVNSLTGPAMVNLPATFSKSGVVPTIVTLIFVSILTCLCCLHFCNTISKVPNNATFQKEVEFSQSFEHYWGRKWFLVSQLLFFGCVSCLNISSIVDTAHVVDTFLGHWCPRGSVALKVSASMVRNTKLPSLQLEWIFWDYSVCSHDDLLHGECLPFMSVQPQIATDFLTNTTTTNNTYIQNNTYTHDSNNGILLTAGNAITTLVFLPLALMDLKENAAWQVLGFMILLLTSVQFVIQFSMSEGFDTQNVTWWGYDWDDLLGVIMFNFALVIALPAWLYEREQHVPVPVVICTSTGLSVVLYVLIGLLGCLAMPNVSENMLESMMSGIMGPSLQFGASIFAFAIIGLGTPLFSVLVRLNLTASGLCSRTIGNILAVYLPFGISWFLYDSAKVTKLLSWGGVIFTGLVAFILPLLLTYHVVDKFNVEDDKGESAGSVPVYGPWKLSKRTELITLIIMLTITVSAIVVAVTGNIID